MDRLINSSDTHICIYIYTQYIYLLIYLHTYTVDLQCICCFSTCNHRLTSLRNYPTTTVCKNYGAPHSFQNLTVSGIKKWGSRGNHLRDTEAPNRTEPATEPAGFSPRGLAESFSRTCFVRKSITCQSPILQWPFRDPPGVPEETPWDPPKIIHSTFCAGFKLGEYVPVPRYKSSKLGGENMGKSLNCPTLLESEAPLT